MKTNITDIFLINSKTSKIIECKNINPLNISNKFKKVYESTHKIYVKNNMMLLVDSKNNKYCEIVEYESNKLVNNNLLVNSTIKSIPLCSFPFIDKYDDIIQRYTITYTNTNNNIHNNKYNYTQQNIHIISETNAKSNDAIVFIRLDNHNESETKSILSLIE